MSWTPQALDDLEAACAYIARDAPRIAEVFARRVFHSVERLEQFPLSGRVVPEFGQEHVRELIIGSYRMIYRVREDEIQLITLHHGARLLTND